MILAGCGEHGGRSIEMVDVDAIAAEIVDVREAVVGREGRKVGMRALLAISVGPVNRVVLGPDGGAQASIGDKKAGCAAAAVIGRDQRVAGVVDRNVASSGR